MMNTKTQFQKRVTYSTLLEGRFRLIFLIHFCLFISINGRSRNTIKNIDRKGMVYVDQGLAKHHVDLFTNAERVFTSKKPSEKIKLKLDKRTRRPAIRKKAKTPLSPQIKGHDSFSFERATSENVSVISKAEIIPISLSSGDFKIKAAVCPTHSPNHLNHIASLVLNDLAIEDSFLKLYISRHYAVRPPPDYI